MPGLPQAIPAHWTPEQALAVFELLDELRECIWVHYGLHLQQLIRDQRLHAAAEIRNDNLDDPPF